MARIYFSCSPYDKSAITLALEAGVDGIVVPSEYVASVAELARGEVIANEELSYMPITSKSDEEAAISALQKGEKLVLSDGWEVIPVENMLAQTDNVWVEAPNVERARLANGILERGVAGIVIPSSASGQIREIVAQCKITQPEQHLSIAEITRIAPSGLGHRVCIDTLTIMHKGQGMLVGNSSAFTFLVHAETEHNEYVAARPFRVNAGGVHEYIRLPDDRTTYLGEIRAGSTALVVDAKGNARVAIVGRVKIEIRPMLLIEAKVEDEKGGAHTGSIFLQNAETIRLTSPDGEPISVVKLKPGDKILCRLDQAGRHFGMRVAEEISEV